MIEIKNEVISGIPVIEMFAKGEENSQLPIVFFYHGWESRKERVLEHGYRLAQLGFRAVLPEALDHGERIGVSSKENDPMNFWKVVLHNVSELPILSKYYLDKNKVRDGQISVAGLSMGGITVSAMLTQYDWIHSAVILMGSPDPAEFSKWLLKNYKIDGAALYDLLDQEVIHKKLKELDAFSLEKQPEKIANRPVYFWHGTEDPTVPIHMMKNFIKEIQNESYSKNIVFEISKGVEHEVPREIVLQASAFLKKHKN